MNVNLAEKYRDIAEDIKEQIDSGAFQEKLPGQRQLAEKYSANVITIRKALSLLESEGIIEKKPCKGIFIKKLNSGISNSQLVGCLMPSQGHLYTEMTNLLASGLQINGYFPLLINTLKHQMSEKDFIIQLEKVIGTEPAGIILDGHYEFPHRIFSRNCRHIKNLTVIFRSEHPFPNALKVLSDEFHGGYIGGSHLIEQGCRKIIYLHPLKNSFLLRPGSERIFNGFEAAVKDSKYSSKIEYFTFEAETFNPELNSKIKEWRPDAIFASADYLLKPIYEFVQAQKIKIPRDMALLGYYNTPWAEMYPVPLSSISIEPEKIVKCAIDKTLQNINGAQNTETIMIKPSLLKRESSLKNLG
jgi:DNA-binding LacI/PurR family transcriptional regulator